MMKKIAALVGAGALLLGMAGSAFAWWPMFGSDNVAIVENSAVAEADTGGNGQGNAVIADDDVRGDATVSGSNDMTTGNADAYAGALVVANTHIGFGVYVSSHDDDVALVGNEALAGAFTGDNGQGNAVLAGDDVGSWWGDGETDVSGDNNMDTGDADSTARAWVIVNTHWGSD